LPGQGAHRQCPSGSLPEQQQSVEVADAQPRVLLQPGLEGLPDPLRGLEVHPPRTLREQIAALPELDRGHDRPSSSWANGVMCSGSNSDSPPRPRSALGPAAGDPAPPPAAPDSASGAPVTSARSARPEPMIVEVRDTHSSPAWRMRVVTARAPSAEPQSSVAAMTVVGTTMPLR